MNFSESMCGLAADIANLASVTGGFGWDRGPDSLFADPKDLGAKPIPKNDWLRAMDVAVMLGRANAYLPRPTPGADPEGFVWLTWSLAGRKFALELRKDAFVWSREDELGNVRRHTSSRLEDVGEALRTAIPRPTHLAA